MMRAYFVIFFFVLVKICEIQAFGGIGGYFVKRMHEKIKRTCEERTQVNPALLEQARAGSFPEDWTYKTYVYCLSQELGFQDDEGNIQEGKIRDSLGHFTDPSEADQLYQSCVLPNQHPVEIAVYTAKCLYNVKGMSLV